MGAFMSKYIVGFDIGGTDIKSCITNNSGRILYENKIPVAKHSDSNSVLEQLLIGQNFLLEKVKTNINEIIGIGIGVPGAVSPRTGRVDRFIHISGFEDFPFASEYKKLSGCDVIVDNDANMAALGEFNFGKGKQFTSFIFITIGTGIGSGIIIDGHLVRGNTGSTGEVGCMKLYDSGKYCACGQFDCWHSYCSSSALVREAKVRLSLNKKNLLWSMCSEDFKNLTAKHIFDAARSGDAFANQLVHYEVKHLAKGLSSIVNMLDPEAVIIGGGMSEAGDILFGPLKEEMKYHTRPISYNSVKIIKSELGNKAGMLGAVSCFFQKEQVNKKNVQHAVLS